MKYHHTQIGVVIIVALVFAIVFVLIPFLSTGIFHPILIVTLTILVAALALFYSLSVEIENNTLICRFGVGLIQKEIPLSEICQAQAVQNPWYVGWGIRWVPGQCWLWNVSGSRAVELLLKDGKRFRIGTDEPEKLVHAIETNKMMGD